MMARILVVDEEESIRFTFEAFLAEEGHEVVAVSCLEEARAGMAGNRFDVMFADALLPDGSGFDILQEVHHRNPGCPVILTTGFQHFEGALTALRLGAFDYLEKPLRQQALLEVTARALAHSSRTGDKEKVHSSLEAIFRSLADSIVTVDRDMTVLEINHAFEKRCGFSRHMIGEQLERFCEHCSAPCIELLRETLTTRNTAGPQRVSGVCGRRRQAAGAATAYPLLDSDGQFNGAILSIRNEGGFVH